jgi:hypothetical protein
MERSSHSFIQLDLSNPNIVGIFFTDGGRKARF